MLTPSVWTIGTPFVATLSLCVRQSPRPWEADVEGAYQIITELQQEPNELYCMLANATFEAVSLKQLELHYVARVVAIDPVSRAL
jgi:hypothetical protein